jgi:hypothetical protein
MPDDRAGARRKLAAECLAMAQRTSDLKLRAALLRMAQRWLDLANDEFNPAEPDLGGKTFYNFELQAKIGQKLQSHFELPVQLSPQLSTLLMQMDANA